MKIYTVRNSEGETDEVQEDKIQEAEADGFYPVVTDGKEEDTAPFAKLAEAEKDGFKPIVKGEGLLSLPTMERMGEEASKIGQSVGETIQAGVEGFGDVIEYLDAPMKEAAMIPKRIFKADSLADVGQALYEPVRQLEDSSDPSMQWNEVFKEYSVPDVNLPAAMALAQQSQNPYAPKELMDELKTQMLEPGTTMSLPNIAGAATEMAVGGKGLEAGLKVLKGAAKYGAKGAGHVTDMLTGSPMTSNLGKQMAQTVKDTGSEIADISRKFGNPKLVNTKEFFDGEKANIVDEVFGKDVPNVVKYTGDSEIVKMEKKLQSSADYGGEYAKKHNDSINKVWDYVKEIPQKIVKATKLGRPLDEREAGNFLIQQYNAVKNAVINKADFTRASIIQQLDEIPNPTFLEKLMGKSGYPPITASSKKTINDRVKLLTDKVVAMKIGKNNPLAQQLDELKNIMKDVDSIKDIRELQLRIKSVAELAFNIDSPFNPQDKKSLEQLYFAMTNAFTDNVKHYFGDDIAKSLVKNNEELSKFFKRTNKIDSYLYERSQTKLSPEAAFKDLVEKGNSKELEQLIETLTPEDIDVLRASYLNNKLFHKEALEFGDDIVSPNWQQIANNLNKDTAFKVLLKPEEQNRILNALALGNRVGKPIRKSQSATLSSLKDRVLLNPAIKRHVGVMEGSQPVFDQTGMMGLGRDILKTGLVKQNVLDELSPMMTPEERLMMIDQDPNMSPSQRAVEKQKVFEGR